MKETKKEYILAANKTAMKLYNNSISELVESDSREFMVFQFSHKDEVLQDLEEWEETVTINKAIHDHLYSNLCLKFREIINDL